MPVKFMSDLGQRWLLDQSRVFCAGFLSGLGNDEINNVEGNPQLTRVNSAAAFLAEMQAVDFATASDSLLGLLCDLEKNVYDPQPEDPADLSVSLEAQHNFARAELNRRQGKQGGAERSVLLNHAGWLLQDDKMNLANVLKWLKWNSSALKGEIEFLLEELKTASVVDETRLDRWLLQARSTDYTPHQRLKAIDEVHDWVLRRLVTAQQKSKIEQHSTVSVVAPWWTRLCLNWRNSLFFWPLFSAGPDDLLDYEDYGNDLSYGMSLPVLLTLEPNGEQAVRFDPVPRMLDLSAEWRNAFGVGLSAGQAMWRSQNSRLRQHAPYRVQDKERSDLVVDLSLAEEIVSVLGYDESEPHPLAGRSAEAYWAQACLSLLLDASVTPAGVATGCIEEVQGALRVMPVGGLEQKLFYANSFGFSRVILPGDERALLELESERDQQVKQDATEAPPHTEAIAAYLKFRDKIEERGLDPRIEVNFCPEARTSADALQSKGWRRAAFFRLPETQRDFSVNLSRLHLSAAEPTELSAHERRIAGKDPWRTEETEALKCLDAFLLGDTSKAVRHVSREDLDGILVKIAEDTKKATGRVAIPIDAETAIGKWLAWQDHQTRRGPIPETERRRSGLGLLALKSQVGDYEYRLWATIAEELDATSDWFTHFRWATEERAAERLADLLGNSIVDRRISRTAPPDLLVIFDEASFTGPRSTVVPFETDFSADWRPILDPRWQDSDAPFPLEKHLHTKTDGFVGVRSSLWPEGERRRTRILIIQGPPAEPNPKGHGPYIPDEYRDLLERLAVFRFGFSVHGAFSMLNHECVNTERKSFPEVRRILSDLRGRGFVKYTRGTYFIAPRFRALANASSYRRAPTFQMQAAFALCALLQPSKKFVSENRDKSLSAEKVQEALWHMSEAIRLLPPKDTEHRPRADDAKKSLSLIARIPDWDSFNELQRRGAGLIVDSYDLGRELLASEEHVAQVDGEELRIYGHRVGKLLDAIGRYGNGILKKIKDMPEGSAKLAELEKVRGELLDECNAWFLAHGGHSYDVEDRVKRRLASHYVGAIQRLNGKDDVGAWKILEDLFSAIENECYFDCNLKGFLDTYLPAMWWKWLIYQETDISKRRRWCRLGARNEVLKAIHTGEDPQWDHKFEEPWTVFFRRLPKKGCEKELSEMLSYWWRARGFDPNRRARYRDVVLGLNAAYLALEGIRPPYSDTLKRGGSNLLARISQGALSDEDERSALAYISSVNLSDPVLAYSLVSWWKKPESGDSLIPSNFEEWIGRSECRREFIGALVSNPGSWAAMFCSTKESEHRDRAITWAIATRVIRPADLPKVNPALLDIPRNETTKKEWKYAAERAGILGPEVRRENTNVLTWVARELRTMVEGS